MNRILIVLGLTTFLILSACSEKKTVLKTPENIVAKAAGASVTREFVYNAKYDSGFLAALDQLNFYQPDNCLQVANLRTQDGKLLAMVLEMSASPCPGSGLVDDANVILQMEMVMASGYYELQTQQWGQTFALGKVTKAGGGYTVLDLCTRDYTYDTCDIEIENSLFNGVFLY